METQNQSQTELKCRHCGKVYKSQSWLTSHEQTCKKNPANATYKPNPGIAAFLNAINNAGPNPRMNSREVNNRRMVYNTNPYYSNYSNNSDRTMKVLWWIGGILGAIIIIGVIVLYCLMNDYSYDYGSSSTPSSSYSSSSSYDSGANYPWIVGTWALSTSYGTEVIQFDGDGRSGSCISMTTGVHGGSDVEYGTYRVYNDRISIRYNGQSVVTIIEICGAGSLYAGGGYYYSKRH